MPFVRPLKEIESAINAGLINEPVFVQCGNTRYTCSKMTMTAFYDHSELEQMYERADLIVCQAGVGSIMLGLRKKKKVISIARLARFDEHVDDHQTEILEVFSKSGNVLPWRGVGDLPEVLDNLAHFVPQEYPFGQEKVSSAILDFLSGRRLPE